MQVSVLSHFKNVFENDNDNDDDDNDDGGSRCRIDDEDDKGPCKRSQHCWPTKRNNVGPNMLRAFVGPNNVALRAFARALIATVNC